MEKQTADRAAEHPVPEQGRVDDRVHGPAFEKGEDNQKKQANKRQRQGRRRKSPVFPHPADSENEQEDSKGRSQGAEYVQVDFLLGGDVLLQKTRARKKGRQTQRGS